MKTKWEIYFVNAGVPIFISLSLLPIKVSKTGKTSVSPFETSAESCQVGSFGCFFPFLASETFCIYVFSYALSILLVLCNFVECFLTKGSRNVIIWIETICRNILTCAEIWVYFLWLTWAAILSGFLFISKVKNKRGIWVFPWERWDVKWTDANTLRIRPISFLLLI